tara:strand:+ start:249 stop:560 length:312 start_codon:yes stop_codon:yes gene_type:complete
MKLLKIFILLNIIFLFYSCGTLREGFTNQKKTSNDEFLVEKKSPLVMPPDYNELPIPTSNQNQTEVENNKIKDMVSNNTLEENTSKNVDQNFEESLLKKIKKN